MASRIEEWLVSDGMGEFVEYYNPTGNVIKFGNCREQARRTTDSYDAAEIARVARDVYGRKFMKFQAA